MTAFEIWTLIIGSGIGAGVVKLIFTLGKVAKTVEVLQITVDKMQVDLTIIKERISEIDGRLNRLEGAFFERGQWESRAYKMAKNINSPES